MSQQLLVAGTKVKPMQPLFFPHSEQHSSLPRNTKKTSLLVRTAFNENSFAIRIGGCPRNARPCPTPGLLHHAVSPHPHLELPCARLRSPPTKSVPFDQAYPAHVAAVTFEGTFEGTAVAFTADVASRNFFVTWPLLALRSAFPCGKDNGFTMFPDILI